MASIPVPSPTSPALFSPVHARVPSDAEAHRGDVPSLVNLASAFGAFKDASDKEALENLKHVGGLLFWSGRDGDTVTSDVFVEST